MSTYLKTAAMSLLSKTLQTFLSKYLSDVDVEGVALPSVYDGSGWGVRLSNVKLREGVQLMKKMPGTVTKRRKRKKRRRRRRRKLRKQTDVNKNNSQKYSGKELAVRGDQEEDIPFNQQTTLNINTQPHYEDKQSSKHCDTRQGTTSTQKPNTAVYYASEEEMEYDNDGTGRPTTPVQQSKSMFSCFYNSRSSSKSNTTISRSRDEKSQNEDSKNIDDIESLPHQEVGKPITSSNHSGFTNTSKSVDTVETIHQTSEAFSGMESFASIRSGDFSIQEPPLYNNDEAEYEYEYEEEEYEEEYEVPVQLCLGEGGRIGTLDVRLIGKELHIMVEDAMVTIEAIPILQNDNNGKADDEIDSDDNDDKSISEDMQQSLGEGQASSRTAADIDLHESGAPASTNKKQTATKPKAMLKRDTVGDRVLADNPLARLISAIPHLFLRDIRIRLIVRDKAMSVPGTDGPDASNSNNSNNVEQYERPQSSSKDLMTEIGIDFLSVTSGEDILSHFQEQTVEDDFTSNTYGSSANELLAAVDSSTNSTKPPALLKIPSHASAEGNGIGGDNEYLIRHIRTGRGPAAGIFVHLFTPSTRLPSDLSTATAGVIWARQRWISSAENCFLQCSGVDIQARIHMGTKKAEAAGYSWFYGEYVEEEDGSEYDSMFLLGGMDTIAPGPQLPLPPMEPRMDKKIDESGTTARSEIENVHRSSIHPGAEVYETDKNGIQSCKVPSLFHRVSRGLQPTTCRDCKHLPAEVCSLCWKALNANVEEDSSLDSSLPMPGLALQISFRDPLEVNMDRASLNFLGLLKSLFTKPTAPTPVDCPLNKVEDTPPQDSVAPMPPIVASVEDATEPTASSTGFFSSYFYGSSKEPVKEEEPSEAFSSCMQPEKIAVIGIYVTEICLRVHVMREDKDDGGLSFCYWHIAVDCLTIDRQTLNADEQIFQDVKLDVGRLVWDQYRGIDKKNVITLGLPQPPKNRGRCDSQASAASSMIDDHEQLRAPWPSTACALLDIGSPLESLVYKSRERHGLQLRFVSLSAPKKLELCSKSMIHLKLGVTIIDTPLAIRHEVNQIVKDLRKAVSSKSVGDGMAAHEKSIKNAEDRITEDKQERVQVSSLASKALMAYTIQIDSGNVKVPPLINARLPLTRLSGEHSSEAGIYFETVLEKLELAYGSRNPDSNDSCLTLPQIAALPENARMHILLCLKDLSSLEKALFVQKEKNSFRRIKSIDKGILKMAKKIAKRDVKAAKRKSSLSVSLHGNQLPDDPTSRRQHVLSEIMKLDDAELSELWSVHQRYRKKMAKKRGDI